MAAEPARTSSFTGAFPDLRAMSHDELTLGAISSMIKRRAAIAWGTLCFFLVLVTLYAFVGTRRYQATGQIQIQKDSAGAFGLESSVMGDQADSASDALDYNITLQTEANILMSDALAMRVIEELHLETTEDFYPPGKKRHGLRLPAWVFFWRKPVEPMTMPLDQAPNRRYTVLKIFASHLKIEPVTGTRLIDVRYSNPNPQLAADVVNHLISALVDYTFQTRFTATAQASKWLTTQLDDLRQQTESLQAKTIELQRDTGMFGNDESHNVVLARLESLNNAFTTAESNRILKEAIYRVASSGDPELISGLSGNSGIGVLPSMANSLGLIQSLRAQEANVKAELDQDKVKYGPAYPRVAELQAELSGLDQSIHDEVYRIGERAHTDYQIAVQAETAAKNEFGKQKKLANALNDKAIAYELAKQEADSSRDVYEGLLSKLKQAGVLEGLRSTNITIVNPASMPPPNRPKSPNLLMYYIAAILTGSGLGALLAFVRDMTDTKVRSPEDLERVIGSPLMGVIPEMEPDVRLSSLSQVLGASRLRHVLPASQERQIAIANYVDSPFSESMRSLRTSLMLSRSGGPPQVLLISSSDACEGKSTVSLNLATVLTQQGARVLLVDADLRRPILHQRIGLCPKDGLSAILSSERAASIPQQVETVPNLFVLCGGQPPPFPAELLGSKKMETLLKQWREEYDFIVLDGPPVLPVTDAVVLAQQCDAILMIARHRHTETKAIRRGYQTIARHLPQHVVLGTVLNAVPSKSSDFYDYYGYRSLAYSAGKAVL